VASSVAVGIPGAGFGAKEAVAYVLLFELERTDPGCLEFQCLDAKEAAATFFEAVTGTVR
jgi:hypothetical protein